MHDEEFKHYLRRLDLFTKEALDDNRYKSTDSWQGNYLNHIHPKEWYLTFALTEPFKVVHNPLHGKKSEHHFYPRYTKDYGWEWITAEHHRHLKIKKELYERMLQEKQISSL